MVFDRSHVLLTTAIAATHLAALRGDRRTRATLTRLNAENQRLREENERLRRDPVTGSLLRLAWTDAAQQALRTLRAPALLLLDINNLKPVNDLLGHAAGDDLLREIVLRLQTLIGPHALIGRLGGDEFAVLLDLPRGNWRDYLQTVVNACAVEVGGLRCGAAFGAARPIDVATRGTGRHHDSAPDAALRHHLDRLLHAADLAMYRAKRRCHDHGLATFLACYGPQDATVPGRLTPAVARVRDHGSQSVVPFHSRSTAHET
ncbi:GGDEF domain-containing protein [Actinokineospora cianjurensis]|uniref:Diguanylate cyclase (GGDEF)-like protein n=1 Tax=Actinokineospora cianjurensis TaxID=585224 RepID=A0A421AX69_9PSEU|nr:GGDEF domain-containing protein [Actinokineospora cianjurensis]RLK54433.1 diguanylate cyclase (GGDEF)-like protein [Actinokineospora cianjurensis]